MEEKQRNPHYDRLETLVVEGNAKNIALRMGQFLDEPGKLVKIARGVGNASQAVAKRSAVAAYKTAKGVLKSNAVQKTGLTSAVKPVTTAAKRTVTAVRKLYRKAGAPEQEDTPKKEDTPKQHEAYQRTEQLLEALPILPLLGRAAASMFGKKGLTAIGKAALKGVGKAKDLAGKGIDTVADKSRETTGGKLRVKPKLKSDQEDETTQQT